MNWMRANKLKLNPNKMKTLLLGGSLNWLEGYLPGHNGRMHPLKDQVHSLGVLLGPALSMKAQTCCGQECL